MSAREVTIVLSGRTAELATEQASRLGFPDIGSYLANLITEEAEHDYGAPRHLSPRSREELEALIQEGLDSPSITMTQDDWDQMRRELIARHRARK